MTASVSASPRTARARPSNHSCKLVMAGTGLLFVAFVFVHMVGNLKVNAGAGSFDDYALWLRHAFTPLLPHEGLLWALRIVLLISLVAHVWCAAVLWRRARAARGRHRAAVQWRSFSARTMPLTGVVLLLFVVFHILDLTTGNVGPAGFEHTTATQAHAYANLVGSMQRPAAAIIYLVAMLALALHIAHGTWLAAHDLGVTGQRIRSVVKVTAGLVAIAVLLGNASIPVAVQIGWLT